MVYVAYLKWKNADGTFHADKMYGTLAKVSAWLVRMLNVDDPGAEGATVLRAIICPASAEVQEIR